MGKPTNIYYFHPDHLGTATFVSDANGEPYQFFLNLPFGELRSNREHLLKNKNNGEQTMAEQRAGSWENPYKFNGKELDAETGLYYYGARYYNPRWSNWLSVDPLADKYPHASPYNYCLNNPVIFVDPDGRKVDWYETECGTIEYDPDLTKENAHERLTEREKYLGKSGSEINESNGRLTQFFEDGTQKDFTFTLKQFEIRESRKDISGIIDASIGVLAGGTELAVGLLAEPFTGGASTLLAVDGFFRFTTNSVKLMHYFNNNSVYGNATPNNFGSLTGKLLSTGTPYEQVSSLQAGLGLVNDISLIVTPAGNAGAIKNIMFNQNFLNSYKVGNSYYSTTIGASNNLQYLKDGTK